MMWKNLAKYGVSEPLVNVIAKICTHIEISTSVRKIKTSFPSASGVKKTIAVLPFSFYSPSKPMESMNQKSRSHKPDLSVSSRNYMNKQDTAKKAKALWILRGPSMRTMLSLSF
jgi:hypothetical protein